MCSGPSTGEQTAAANTAAFNQQMQAQFSTEFADAQELQTFLTGQLESLITDPTGFTPEQIADLQSTLINSVGSQLASTTQQQKQAFATSNEAGLPSGVQAMNTAILQGEASSTEAQGLTGIRLQSAQLAQAKQAAALSELGQLSGQETQAGTALASPIVQGNQNQFQQQDVMQQQSTSMWSNILSGVLGAGLSFATGGLSNLTSGLSFFGNALKPAAAPAGGGGSSGVGVGGVFA